VATSSRGYDVARRRLRDEPELPRAGNTVRDLLQSRADRLGTKPFLVWEPFEGEARTLSYQHFRADVERMAGALQARGTRRGDRVLIHMGNSPEFLIAWFACAWIGVIAVSTNTRAAAAEVAYFAEHSEVVGAFVSPEFAATVDAAAPGLRWLVVTGGGQPSGERFEDLLRRDVPAAVDHPDTYDPLCIQYTSGTTARPKAVVWTHANGLWAARLNAVNMQLRPDDTNLAFLPLFHTNALGYSTLGTLGVGATLVLQPRFSASRFWDVSLRHGCAVSCVVPFCARALEEAPAPHNYRLWGLGISWPRMDTRFGLRTLGWWGMTETISHPIVGRADGSDHPLAMGRPSPKYGIAVVDDDGDPVDFEEPGNLLVAGVPGLSLFDRYLHDDDATFASFDEAGWFKTGDRVVRHADGAVSFVDRAKDMFKVGGENVAASEIERVVGSVTGVREAAAVARPDRMLGEVPVVFVVAEGQAADGLEAAIVRRCREELADFKVPVAVHVIDEMPHATLEKIAKGELRARLVVDDDSA
jgi:crotonobetaine/carnitine-CoA ligase